MRILITGSRTWTDTDTITEALREAARDVEYMSDITVVHGGARGADFLASRIAEQHGMQTEEHLPYWDDCGDNCGPDHWRYRNGDPEQPYCPRSGFIRNRTLVNLGADICLAFIRNESKGAGMTADLAEKAGIPTKRYIQES